MKINNKCPVYSETLHQSPSDRALISVRNSSAHLQDRGPLDANLTEQSQVLERLQPTITAHQGTSAAGRIMDDCTPYRAIVLKHYST